MSAGAMPTAAGEEKAMLALQVKLDRMVAKGKPTKRDEALKSFRYLYPRLESYFASGKPMKEVLTAFNEVTQSKMCARTFKDLLDQERARRDQHGNPICCDCCGHPLKIARNGSKVDATVQVQSGALNIREDADEYA